MAYLKIEELRPFTWYMNSGRHPGPVYWDGKTFSILREKFNQADHTYGNHWDEGGCVKPEYEIEPLHRV